MWASWSLRNPGRWHSRVPSANAIGSSADAPHRAAGRATPSAYPAPVPDPDAAPESDAAPDSQPDAVFDPRDHEQLEAHGIAEAEALRQLAVLARPPRFARLDRPCTVGDGIERWSDEQRAMYRNLAAEAVAGGRLSSFVPASGAASRMFKELLAWRARPGALPVADIDAAAEAGDGDARVVQAWWRGLDRFAFWPALRTAVAPAARHPDGPLRPWLDALLAGPADEPRNGSGLHYAGLPKGLLAFHRDASGARTAFEEQLAEGAAVHAPGGGVCRLHLTVSPEHRPGFEDCFAAAEPALRAATGARFDLVLSTQQPATDTLAAAPDGGPFRSADGRLLIRPAGHGALIGNLARSGADLVLLKNIDNVTFGEGRADTVEWAHALFGRLVELTADATSHLAAIDASRVGDSALGAAGLDAARSWLREQFGDLIADHDDPDGAATMAALTRPIRICAMVANTGEPGGGPFWVRGRDGRVARQIVESAEVDPADAEQQQILQQSTHFNPVFLVGALRDRAGRPHDLDAYVDPDAVIVTRKSSEGRELLALERPGLWNGAMAGWNTVFAEVPLVVFNPVKSVLDLLRPAHQPGPVSG